LIECGLASALLLGPEVVQLAQLQLGLDRRRTATEPSDLLDLRGEVGLARPPSRVLLAQRVGEVVARQDERERGRLGVAEARRSRVRVSRRAQTAYSQRREPGGRLRLDGLDQRLDLLACRPGATEFLLELALQGGDGGQGSARARSLALAAARKLLAADGLGRGVLV
jgi:hypothetical protein